ncbi:MAG: ribulose-phosphate 3-epimerase [Clostridia bacterium]|nr:ribulose-phosphate 3-epimerase [Clostridia bacterium]MBR3875981.1 ribulose-phosphate 3-epimerase [Clostridia bacterium]
MTKISPSVLAADLSNLAKEVADIESAGADMVHLDVMDGMFVTNISFGLPVIESLRKRSNMIFDVHLMIDAPERYAERFIEAGADILTFHLEACKESGRLLDEIRDQGVMAGISVKPGTSIEEVYPYLDRCDMVLVMTVEPGYGGQKLIPETIEKVRKLKAETKKRGIDIEIQVDGGINENNAAELINAGASILVAGSSVFKANDRRAAIDALRKDA